MKKERFSLFEEYKNSWKFLKESRNFIYGVIFVFIFFAIIGFFFPAPQFIVDRIRAFVENLIKQLENKTLIGVILFIFFNNLKSSFMGLIFGFILGVPSMIIVIFNGYLVGFISSVSVRSSGIFSLWKLFPHGIFELPAIFISLGLGVKIGSFIFQRQGKKACMRQ